MNNYLSLTKTFFLSTFTTNRKKKKKNNKQIKPSSSLLVTGLTFLLVSVVIHFSLYISASQSKISYENILLSTFGMASIITIFLSIFQMQGTLFKTSDYEFLESLPINKTTIVASKISSVFIANIMEDLLLCIPSLVMYMVFAKNGYVLFIGIIASLFISFIPLIISSLVGALVAIITARVKNNTIFEIIVNILFFALIFAVTFSFNLTKGQAAVAVSNYVPWLYFIKQAFVSSSSWYNILIFIGVNVGALLLTIFFLAVIYRPINTLFFAGNKHKDYKVGEGQKEYKLSKLLFKKEWKMVYKKPAFLINSFVGPLIFLVISLGMVLFPGVFAQGVPSDQMQQVQTTMLLIVPGMGIMMNSIATSTTASFSFEATNLEILYSYPLEAKDVINSKLKVGIIVPNVLNLLFVTIMAIIFGIVFKTSYIYILELILLPILACTNTAIIGAYCGLRWPKLEFESDTQVYKNSAAVSFSMLFNFLPSMIIGGITVALSVVGFLANIPVLYLLSLIIPVVLYVILIIVGLIILNKKGSKLYFKMGSR